MVAMVIMMVGLLGLLQSVNIATDVNLKNHLRDDAARVAEGVMNDMRTSPFDAVFNPLTAVPSRLRNSNKVYSVRRSVTDMTTSKKYQVTVKWAYKNYSVSQSIVSVRGPQ
jgi:type IV pilus assembly protein PilV